MGKGDVNKGIFIGIIAIVTLLAAAMGFMYLNPPRSQMDAATAKSYEEHVKAAQTSSNYPGSPNRTLGDGGSSGYRSPSSAGGSGGYSSPSSGGSSSGYPGGR